MTMFSMIRYLFFVLIAATGIVLASSKDTLSGENSAGSNTVVVENNMPSIGSSTIVGRSLHSGGPIVLSILLILVFMSVATWALLFSKWIHLRKMEQRSSSFSDAFHKSRSLKELNNKLGDFSYNPLREVFKAAYAELVKNSYLKDQPQHAELAVGAAMDNMKRSLQKSKLSERRQLERYLSFLAISASACPFIGLFGTVWGIMSAFEGIAQSGSTSLATVAPGISEALIATAFGLAAAIPAVIAYNIASNKIRGIMFHIDQFSADFLNITERYFVSEKIKAPKDHDSSVVRSPNPGV